MADFGKAGKLTFRAHDVAALVKLSAKEYLHYRLTVQGASPIFTFACMHGPRLSEHEFAGHPKQVYEWTWCRTTAFPNLPNQQSDAADDMFVIAMSFITAVKYTLRVEQRDHADNVIRTIKDVDYESQAPQDNFSELLRVFTS